MPSFKDLKYLPLFCVWHDPQAIKEHSSHIFKDIFMMFQMLRATTCWLLTTKMIKLYKELFLLIQNRCGIILSLIVKQRGEALYIYFGKIIAYSHDLINFSNKKIHMLCEGFFYYYYLSKQKFQIFIKKIIN